MEHASSAAGRLVHDLLNRDPFEETPEVFYSWATRCWSCNASSWVWFHNALLRPLISAACERVDVKGEMSRRISGRVPLAIIGTVSTREGGSYRGYRCHQCDAVLGKHFLLVDLVAMLATRSPELTTSYFSTEDQG